uniref:Uncharacterized protein n=1 Tax=Rhizophagus irregularis (strain DAOM 181602 / DAOM 197198 / MUCL 43194) TaxID=747089 RepID=U9SS82_RHIID
MPRSSNIKQSSRNGLQTPGEHQCPGSLRITSLRMSSSEESIKWTFYDQKLGQLLRCKFWKGVFFSLSDLRHVKGDAIFYEETFYYIITANLTFNIVRSRGNSGSFGTVPLIFPIVLIFSGDYRWFWSSPYR